jgi:hypothetical protein
LGDLIDLGVFGDGVELGQRLFGVGTGFRRADARQSGVAGRCVLGERVKGGGGFRRFALISEGGGGLKTRVGGLGGLAMLVLIIAPSVAATMRKAITNIGV